MKIIRYRMERPTALSRYVLEFSFARMAFPCIEVDSGDADVVYGDVLCDSLCVRIPRRHGDVFWRDLLDGKIPARGQSRQMPFDIVHAIGILLTDDCHRGLGSEAFDEHRRLRFEFSVQAKNGVRYIPIVNAYVNCLRAYIEDVIGIPAAPIWPVGKTCAIGLTHDVDYPDKYAWIWDAPLYSGRLSLSQNLRNNIDRMKCAVVKALDPSPEDYWLFDEIMAAEERFGFRSTFFFASMNRFGSWGAPSDVVYDIRRKRFAQVIAEIVSRGFEIGLHASYLAHEDVSRFEWEKKTLEQIAGITVKGVRHHRWHLGSDAPGTLFMHERVGFEYDSSVAFNDHFGFRRNVAWPYYPWFEKEDRALRVLQMPVVVMDGSLMQFEDRRATANTSLERLMNAVRSARGLGVIDWHVRTSFPKNKEYREWGAVYVELLAWLAEQDDIWVTSAGTICSWLGGR